MRVPRSQVDASDEQTARVIKPVGAPAAGGAARPDPLSDLTGPLPRGEGAGTRVARALSRAFSSGKQPREWAEVLAAVQQPVTTGRRIAVASARGGAGKTALCALVGTVFAQHRADPVLALDAYPDDGSLAWRLGVDPTTRLSALAPVSQSGDLASLSQVLPRTSRGLWVAPGEFQGHPDLPRDVARGLSRLFAVELLDCGNGMATPAVNAVLADSHVVVVAVPATPDGVRATSAALSRVSPAALQRVVVALNAVDERASAVLRWKAARERFERMGVPVVAVPHDRHVAAGGVIAPDRLAEPTILAGSRLAAWALGRARRM